MGQSASVSATTCTAVLKPPRGAAGKSNQNQTAHAKRIQKIVLDLDVAVEANPDLCDEPTIHEQRKSIADRPLILLLATIW